MYKSKNPMLNLPDGLAQQIEQVTDYQIDELIRVVAHRFNQLRPKQEGFFVSLSKELAQHRREIDFLVQDLMKGL